MLTRDYLGLAYVQKGMYNEGIAQCEMASMIFPGSPFALSALTYVYAVSGKRAEAQKVLNQLMGIPGDGDREFRAIVIAIPG